MFASIASHTLSAVGALDDIEYFFAETPLGQVLYKIVLVLLILIVGWILSKLISGLVFRALSRTDWDDKLAEKLKLTMLLEKEAEDSKAIERLSARVVYYVLLLMTVVAALQFSGLTQVAAPIENLLNSLFSAVPNLLKATLILLVAYIAGTIIKRLLQRALGGLDARFSEVTETEASDRQPFSEGISTVVFWLIMVFGLVGALDALKIDAISGPLSGALEQFVAMLPAVAKAAIIVVAGYVLARIARTVVTNLADSVGVDRVVGTLKLEQVFEKHKPSALLGLLVFFFILLQVTVAAFQQVGLETLSEPLKNMIERFWLLIPDLVVATVIVLAGIVVGRLARGVVENVLKSLGFDKLLDALGFGDLATKNEKLDEPSEFVAFLVMIGIIMLASAQALETLALTTWAAYLNAFLGYALKHVLVALIVIVIGFAIGNYVRQVVGGDVEQDGEIDESRRWMGAIARYAVLVFAFTMAIHQLNVAQDFVLIAFALLFGALCLALALAFGLGSRSVAEEIVQRQYKKARAQLEADSRKASAKQASGAGKVGGGFALPKKDD